MDILTFKTIMDMLTGAIQGPVRQVDLKLRIMIGPYTLELDVEFVGIT